MKQQRYYRIFTVAVMLLTILHMTITTASAHTLTKEEDYYSADVESVWEEHNVWNGGLFGMNIHVEFDIEGYKGYECSATAWFYDAYGNPLRDFNGLYKTWQGQVCSYTTFSPRYYSSNFSDLVIFIPYTELHMAPGSHNLQFFVGIFGGGTQLASSSMKTFTFYRAI